MSSSRVHIVLIGTPGTCLAMVTAWISQSCVVRRPNPPPRSTRWTSQAVYGRPAACAVAASAASPFCVGHQTSQRAGVHTTVAFIGSIGAWFWDG